MDKKYKLDNGWIIKKEGSNPPILYVTPIKNTIFKKKLEIEINDEIFRDIVLGERNIKELFRKHKLHTIIIKKGSIDVKPEILSIKKPNQVNGKGFILTKENDEYFLEYQLSKQGGGSRKFEINEEIYLDAIKGNYTTSDLFKKYNLYNLDISENE